MKKLTVLVTFALLLFQIQSVLIVGQSKRPKLVEKAEKMRLFEQFVEERMMKDRIPGLTIGFIKDGEVWVKGFGFADLENKVPAEADSAYRLASVTKTMTGAAILQLAEKGKINLDTEIQTYVPYYPKQKWGVTVRQLLVHLGGGQTGSGIVAEYVSPREVVARIAKTPIQFEPGTKFDYQTSGYNLLGAAIEEVSGKSLNEYFRDKIWSILDMKDTWMDRADKVVPKRVQGYVLEKGEIKKAPYIDVSSRFGGGGLIGTVPDMLRWGSNALSGRILTKNWREVMFTPIATKGGRFAGLNDGEWYYTPGWQVFPVNGHYVFYNDGGQIGTNTMVLRIPSQNLTMAFACNIQNIDRMPYVKRLYESITNEPWDIPVYTKDKIDEAIYRGMSNTFNYGSLYFDQNTRPLTTDERDLAKAFNYFNKNVNRSALQTDFQKTTDAIRDGRHPAGETAFIKVGSLMMRKLQDTFYEERIKKYHSIGAIAFFADYIRMYKAKRSYPQTLRFNPEFEKLVAKWNQDWTKTWNEKIRHFNSLPDAELIKTAEKLKFAFGKSEVYPSLFGRLLEIRQSYEARKDWNGAVETAKLAVELYPASDAANTYYAISSIILGNKEEARTFLKKGASINKGGIASARALNQIAFGVAGIKVESAIEWLKIAIEIYPQEAVFYNTIGDFYQKQGQREQAIESYKRAVALDPKFELAKESLKKLIM